MEGFGQWFADRFKNASTEKVSIYYIYRVYQNNSNPDLACNNAKYI